MTLWITEHGGYASGRPIAPLPSEPAIQAQIMSGATTAAQTMSTFSVGTRMVRMVSDVTMWAFFGSSALSTATAAASSTNSERIIAGVPELRVVQPNSRIIASST